MGNKYHAQPVCWCGHPRRYHAVQKDGFLKPTRLCFDTGCSCTGYKQRYASLSEAQYGAELAALAEAGEITDLTEQIPFRLEIKGRLICTYVADFQYRRGVELIVADVKGKRTDVFVIKKKLMRALLGIDVQEIRADGRN